LRVTGGKYSSRQVKCPKGVIRPAMDRMRESMFSILDNIHGKSFLDLFSGSGIVGIEAASRGASPVYFIEKDRIKKRVLTENTDMIETEKKVLIMAAEKFILINRQKFDLIFLDPPFPMGEKQELVKSISKKDLLNDEGILFIHHPSEERWPDKVGNYEFFDRRKYGRSILLFFRKSEELEI
jgi:16S rRNA (guanine966-N2)-methyltransferase